MSRQPTQSQGGAGRFPGPSGKADFLFVELKKVGCCSLELGEGGGTGAFAVVWSRIVRLVMHKRRPQHVSALSKPEIDTGMINLGTDPTLI